MIVEPGGTKSSFSHGNMVVCANTSHPAYSDPDLLLNKVTKLMASAEMAESWSDAMLVAKAVFEAAGREKPPLRLVTGTDAWFEVKASEETRMRELEDWKDVSLSCGGSFLQSEYPATHTQRDL